MHAFGLGIIAMDHELKNIDNNENFTPDEIKEILIATQQTDAYELGLRILHVSPTSSNKKVLDQIIIIAAQTARHSVGSHLLEPINIKSYMQVLYNAGVTMLSPQMRSR
jgi:hypothetical protein